MWNAWELNGDILKSDIESSLSLNSGLCEIIMLWKWIILVIFGDVFFPLIIR